MPSDSTYLSFLRRRDLIDAPLMPSTGERGVEPEREDVVRQPEGDDASAHGEHVGVVVLAGKARRIKIVAEGGPHSGHLVGGNLLALPAAAEHDAAIGLSLD